MAVEMILRVLVSAHEDVGDVGEALGYLRELTEVVRTQREQAALMHHKYHMERLERDQVDEISQEHLLERKEKLLEGKLADRRYRELSTESLERLAVTAELRDDSTGEHSYRVGLLASLLARDLGCDEEFIFNMDLAGRLHDIGKIGIPDHILLKPGRLTEIEFNVMKTHTTVGAELLARSNLPQMQVAEEIARYHHERWDGKGYPDGLAGEGIPKAARITALADVFDALTHARPYKHAWPVADSIEEIKRLSGTHFDPEMTPVFIALVHRLMREHGDLDEYLGQAARKSAFIQARKNIAATLRRRDDERTLDARR
jgi:putative two-component system response regulator